MDLERLLSRLREAFPDAHEDQAYGAHFFSRDTKRKHPFVTVVTQDDPYDASSNLDRKGFYRLNVSLGKEAFRARFAEEQAYDPTAPDILFPHPVYAYAFWASVVKPSEPTIDSLWPLLESAYQQAKQ